MLFIPGVSVGQSPRAEQSGGLMSRHLFSVQYHFLCWVSAGLSARGTHPFPGLKPGVQVRATPCPEAAPGFHAGRSEHCIPLATVIDSLQGQSELLLGLLLKRQERSPLWCSWCSERRMPLSAGSHLPWRRESPPENEVNSKGRGWVSKRVRETGQKQSRTTVLPMPCS